MTLDQTTATHDVQKIINNQIANHPIILYMKGTLNTPRCHFSAQVVQCLNACHASFTVIDVLEDPIIRSGIKQYSNWPTIPQLYIKGEFIGGCDIVTELFETGQLQEKIQATMTAS